MSKIPKLAIKIYVTNEEFDRFNELANRVGIPVSSWMRVELRKMAFPELFNMGQNIPLNPTKAPLNKPKSPPYEPRLPPSLPPVNSRKLSEVRVEACRNGEIPYDQLQPEDVVVYEELHGKYVAPE